MKNLSKTTSKLLKHIDVFGLMNNLTINNKPKYTTRLGGILTIFMVLLAVVIFLYFGQEMYSLKNPNSFRSEVFEKTPEIIKFSKDSYFFMFGVEDFNTVHFRDDSIYTASVVQEIFNSTGTFTFNIPIEPCQEHHLPTDPEQANYFRNAPKAALNKLFCINENYLDSMSISGSFDSDFYVNIKITIYPCINSTNNNNSCQSREVMQNKLGGYFAFYTLDYVMDPNNYENPGVATGTDYFGYLKLGNVLRNSRFIATTIVNTDDGWLFTNQNTKKYPTYNNDKEAMMQGDDSTLTIFRMRKFHTNMIIERKYKKLQDVLAEMGGILNIIYVLFALISHPFVKSDYQSKLANKCFNFEIVNEKKTKKKLMKKKKKLSEKLTDLKQNKYIKDIKEIPNFENTKNIKTIPTLKNIVNIPTLEIGRDFKSFKTKNKTKTIGEFLKLSHKNLEIGFWNRIRWFFHLKNIPDKEKNIQINQMKKANTLINRKLNITHILKKISDIDKLKMLILDTDQIKLFDYLPKPTILRNQKISMASPLANSTMLSHLDEKYIEEEDQEVKYLNLCQAYKKIYKKNEMTEMDKKLVSFLDDRIKHNLTSQISEIEHSTYLNYIDEPHICDENKEDFISKLKNYI